MIAMKDFLQLTKFNLSLTVSLSLLFGFVLAKNSIDISILFPFAGVLLLALGVSGLNQVQEYKEDSKMPRTQNRPIASGRINAQTGLFISSVLITLAFINIYLSLQLLGIIIFISVIVVYNFLYTTAKKYTIYAAIYGAILGIIPPFIGWISAKESLFTMQFVSLALFYFVWQVPHFWLLNLKYYKEYEKAQFPTITRAFGVDVLERITFIWLLLTLLCGLLLTFIFSLNSMVITLCLCTAHIVMTYYIFLMRVEKNYLQTFIAINAYMLGIMILLMINALFFAA